MRGHPEEVDQALSTLAQIIKDGLIASGWTARDLDSHRIATLTRDAQNGVMATAVVGRTSLRWPDDWPVEVAVRLGVGYEPALNLMPLLTLRPVVSLLGNPVTAGGTPFTVALNNADDVASAGRRVVAFVNEHALSFAEQFADAAAIAAAIQLSRRPSPPDAAHDEDQTNWGLDTKLRLVFLAAIGRHADVRALLSSYPADQGNGPIQRDNRRFIRQLTRWLDAGAPTAPPVAETLAKLPRRPSPPRRSWSAARADAKAKQEALDAARTRSKGKNLNQLKELVANEFARRGIDISPSGIAFDAEMLRLEQQPFGRARSALTAIRMLISSGGDAIRLIRNAPQEDPDWLRPPDRASYPIRAGREHRTAVRLDPSAESWIRRVLAEAPRRLGSYVLIDVWLDQGDQGAGLVAHIGERRVGTIDETAADAFRAVMRAAELFDEAPVIRGLLGQFDEPVLEIAPCPSSKQAIPSRFVLSR